MLCAHAFRACCVRVLFMVCARAFGARSGPNSSAFKAFGLGSQIAGGPSACESHSSLVFLFVWLCDCVNMFVSFQLHNNLHF